MSLKLKNLSLILIFALPLSANIIISPIDAMKHNYGHDADISKKNMMLSNEQAEVIEQNAKVKLETKIYKIFKAEKDNKTVGYGIIINQKVRSKNGVFIYFINNNSVLKGIEVIAFNEPIEYLPSKTWSSQFENIKTDEMLRVSKEIPTITGATLSARAVTDASRLAFAIYNEVLKDR